jgi:hypothetical protein
MDNDVHELVVRYVLGLQPTNPGHRLLLSLAALLSDDERIRDRFREDHLDNGLVRAVIDVCSPVEACAVLATPEIARLIAADVFMELWNDLYSRTQDAQALRDLGLAICVYSDGNSSIRVPSALADALLRSADDACRVVGLKVLRRAQPSEEELVKACVNALMNGTPDERLGATYELLVYYRAHPYAHRTISDDVSTQLISMLCQARDRDTQATVRDNAARWIRENVEHPG